MGTQAISGASRTFSASATNAKEYTGPDEIEHATGLAKYELQQAQAGNDDPVIVKSFDNYRMVGCVCEEHACHIKWMWLIEGRDKRCACGHWFSLEKVGPAPNRYTLPL